jgi:hypothetical protein
VEQLVLLTFMAGNASLEAGKARLLFDTLGRNHAAALQLQRLLWHFLDARHTIRFANRRYCNGDRPFGS